MRNVTFKPQALEDSGWWIQQDRKVALRIWRLLEETARTPFEGTGKPEPLRGELQGCWSRRITDEHRLVYEVSHDEIVVLACRYHYT
ncbi:MAG: Txe/YoeB family addiction module toxin [Rhodothermales bacterium]|nr:Txe/YoeB family addiction module toxin [Rhodothermales bacterium]